MDDLVGGSALSGDIEIDEFSLIVVGTFSLDSSKVAHVYGNNLFKALLN